MAELNLEAVDTDGAIREAAEDVSGDTRMSFLRKGAMTGGAALTGGAILGALIPGTALAKGAPPSSFGKGDIGILNYALTLEYLESSYYNEVHKNGVVTTTTGKTLLNTVVKDENYHVKFLKKALGRHAAKKPTFDFGKATSSEAEFIATGYVLENTGVHAYLGQAGNIKTPAYLIAAAEIVTVEGRHAGAFGILAGKAVAPNTLDVPWTAEKVLKAVKGTHFIKG
ncbi:MAG: ferritin-like domain-containing protein [Solirubrobacteraceae bacterium]